MILSNSIKLPSLIYEVTASSNHIIFAANFCSNWQKINKKIKKTRLTGFWGSKTQTHFSSKTWLTNPYPGWLTRWKHYLCEIDFLIFFSFFFRWLMEIYKTLDRRYKKNLKTVIWFFFLLIFMWNWFLIFFKYFFFRCF